MQITSLFFLVVKRTRFCRPQCCSCNLCHASFAGIAILASRECACSFHSHQFGTAKCQARYTRRHSYWKVSTCQASSSPMAQLQTKRRKIVPKQLAYKRGCLLALAFPNGCIFHYIYQHAIIHHYHYISLPPHSFTTMSSINILGAVIISKILDIVTHGILDKSAGMEDFRHVAELTTVCKFWKDCMPPYANEILIVERKGIANDGPNDSQLIRDPVWTTNLNYILAMGKQKVVKEMRVVMFNSGPCRLHLATALAALGISATPWPGVEKLFFLGSGVFQAGSESANTERASDINNTISQILAILPHISHMEYYLFKKIGYHPGLVSIPPDASPLYFIIQRALLRRITKLQCFFPFHSGDLLAFTGSLTHIDLNINVVNNLGRVSLFDPAPVQTLRLYELTKDKSPWYLFKTAADSALTFPNLRDLAILYYHDHMEPTPSTYSTDKLYISFPVLKRLLIARTTYHVAGFYKILMGSQPVVSCFAEPVNRLHYIDHELLRTTQRLRIFAEDHVGLSMPLLPRDHVTKLYEALSAVTRAQLVNSCFPFPALIRWHNLRYFDIQTDIVALTEVTRLLPQLPSLWYLRIVCLSMDESDGSSRRWYRHTIESETRRLPVLDVLQPISTTLQCLHFRADRFIDIEGLARLTKQIPSLMEMSVLGFYVDELKEELSKVQRGDVEVKEFPHKK